MLILEILVAAFQALRANLLRSFLTALGIIIGVGAVITMVALGTGAQKAVEDRIAALGTNVLTVFGGQRGRIGPPARGSVQLTADDYQALVRDAHLLKSVVPEMQQSLQIGYGNGNANVRVTGTTADYARVRNFTVKYGRMFTAGEDAARQRYAVLGASVPGMLNANAAGMINQTIMVRGIPFEVIGVFEEKGVTGGFFNADEQIVIPLETAQYRIFGTNRLNSIGIEIGDDVVPDHAMIDIERVLRRQHRIQPGGDNDFSIFNQRDLLEAQQQASQIFTSLLAGIAAVSLLVGGIGIMNIMLVSVTERTREIGVRKALGATQANILLQFLIESLTLCLIGGAVGILLGSAAAITLAKVLKWNTLISPASVVIAFGFSALVGLFFGIWPARRAARLDPIMALRYE